MPEALYAAITFVIVAGWAGAFVWAIWIDCTSARVDREGPAFTAIAFCFGWSWPLWLIRPGLRWLKTRFV